MFRHFKLLLVVLFFQACQLPGNGEKRAQEAAAPIQGTWRLLSGTVISGRDTVRTDYTRGQEMIKIISPTHFAFMRHDLQGGKDSTAAIYVAGGGRAEMTDSTYTEWLDYFTDRAWEGNRFDFRYRIAGDTLVTIGVEKVAKAGVDHLNMETYLRVKQ